jgi:hypothetical protein
MFPSVPMRAFLPRSKSLPSRPPLGKHFDSFRPSHGAMPGADGPAPIVPAYAVGAEIPFRYNNRETRKSSGND